MKSNFENSTTIKKQANMKEHDSIKLISNQYLETTRLLIQTYEKILIKYSKVEEKDNELIEKLFEKIIYLFRISNKNLFGDITKVVGSCLKIDKLTIKKKYFILNEVRNKKKIESWIRRNSEQIESVYKFLSLIHGKITSEQLLEDSKLFKNCLNIFFESLKCLSTYQDFSTYLFSLEKLIKEFNLKLFVEILNEKVGEKDISENERLYIGFLKSIFQIRVTKTRLNKLYIGILDLIFEEIKAKIKCKDVNLFCIRVIELCFMFNNLKDKPEEYSIEVYKEESNALFIKFYTNFSEWIDEGISIDYFDMIFSLFDIIPDTFEVFYKNNIMDKPNKIIYQIEIDTVTKILNYLLRHLLTNYEQLKDQFFITSYIFFNNLRKCDKVIQNLFDDKICDLMKKFYLQLFQIIEDNGKKFEKSNKKYYNLFMLDLIKFLRKSIIQIINLKKLENPNQYILTLELVQSFAIYNKIETPIEIYQFLFDNVETKFIPKIHFLLIFEEVSELIISENNLKIRSLCSEFFKVLFYECFDQKNTKKKSSLNIIYIKDSISKNFLDKDLIFQPKLVFKRLNKNKLNLFSEKLKIFLEEHEERGISKEQFEQLLQNKEISKLINEELMFIL